MLKRTPFAEVSSFLGPEYGGTHRPEEISFAINPDHGRQSGLGLEFTRQYEADGWQVFATCRHPNSAADLQNLTKANMLKIFRLDVTDETTIKETSRQIKEPVDVLINCTGIDVTKGLEMLIMQLGTKF